MLQALDARSNISAGMLQTLDKLSDAARQRLDPSVNVRAFIDRLCAEGLHSDAVDVLTHLLPKQYCVAWACECVQELNAHGAGTPADIAALSVTKRWLADPSEENRRAAVELADRLRFQGPGAWLAAAAGWTAGQHVAGRTTRSSCRGDADGRRRGGRRATGGGGRAVRVCNSHATVRRARAGGVRSTCRMRGTHE
jgi:hypothetical protein